MNKKIIFITFIMLFFMLCFVSGDAKAMVSQTFQLTYSFRIKYIPRDAKEIKVWLPYPPEDQYQKILKAEINVPGKLKITKDKKLANRIIYGVYHNQGTSMLKGSIIYDVKRLERLQKPLDSPVTGQDSYPSELMKYLQPSKLVTISPRINKIAKEITAGKATPLGKAKSIYDYVFETMEYNKAVPGWGHGDTERACDIRKGNCTDFHSLFISLARASNIPAKFVIGFNIPDKQKSVVGGYHCWAEFYVNGLGWVPVDISEAWQDKSKKEYYFGNLDKNRIEFTVGRDIVLSPAQNGEPLNYFIYPYVEIDGKMAYGIETSFASDLL